MTARVLLRATTVLVVVAAAAPASAKSTLRVTASAEAAEVGEAIRIEVSAMSSDEAPSNPRLQVPPLFTVQGPSVGSSSSFSLQNGSFTHQTGISATWIIVGSRPGHYVIGPATVVESDGTTTRGDSVNIEIVAPGTLQRQQRRRPRSPFDDFDPFSMFPKIPNFPNLDDLDDTRQLNAPEPPPDFAVQTAPDPIAFLRATVTPDHAVVGQQVTLRVYAYGSRGPFEETGASEPSRGDFLSQVLVDSSFRQPRVVVSVGDTRFLAVKLREIALFPLHAGVATVGPMRMGFRGPGYPETRPMQGLLRESPELKVTVTEPPVNGRPPGYELGDVGNFSLSAQIEPRRFEAGGALSATIRLEGTGNVPDHVKLPERKGVEWLEPTTTEGLNTSGPLLGGWRQFRYVVRIDEPGVHDLGEVTLPYYDPAAGKYGIARVALGTVEVTPGKAAAAPPKPAPGAASGPRDPFEGLGGPRKQLAPVPPPASRLTDKPLFWILLAGGPLLVLALRGLWLLGAATRRLLSSRADSRSALARRALGEARAAAEARNASQVAFAVERAVYATIEDRLALKARAVLRDQLATTLSRHGADAALAKDVVDVLDACDTLRFAGSTESPGALVERAQSVVSRFARVRAVIPEQAA